MPFCRDFFSFSFLFLVEANKLSDSALEKVKIPGYFILILLESPRILFVFTLKNAQSYQLLVGFLNNCAT